MEKPVSFDIARTAVLSMDLQTGIVSIYAKGQADLLTRVASVLMKARDQGLTVIHVQVGFRPGLPESWYNQAAGQLLEGCTDAALKLWT